MSGVAEARDIALIWAAPGFQPIPATTDTREAHPTLKAACDAATASREDGKLPWLRAGVGFGSTILNVQGIELLRAAFEEGKNSK